MRDMRLWRNRPARERVRRVAECRQGLVPSVSGMWSELAMPCMCGDSQCPSCGTAQGTLSPRAYVFKVRYIEPDGDVDDEGHGMYTGNVLRLTMLDSKTLDEVDCIEFAPSEVFDMIREVEHWDTGEERLALIKAQEEAWDDPDAEDYPTYGAVHAARDDRYRSWQRRKS